MDKKTIFAMVLIALIIILMPQYQKYILGHKPQKRSTSVTDTLKKETIKQEPIIESTKQRDPLVTIEEDNKEPKIKIDSLIMIEGAESEQILQLESNKISVLISNKGGGSLLSFELKNYERFDSTLVNMIDPLMNNDLYMSFQLDNGDYLETDNYLFVPSTNLEKVNIEGKDSYSIEYKLKIKNGELRKKYTFYDDVYHFDIDISFTNAREILLNGRYQIGWKNGLPSTESYAADDYNYGQAFVYMGEELESYEVKDEGEKELTNLTGTASWLAVRTKYFITSIINVSADISEGVYFSGKGIKKDDYVQRQYNTGYYAKYKGGMEGDKLRYYIGPLDHKELEKYDNDMDLLIMNNGWYERMFRPFSRYLILPVLEFLHSFIPNYGIVIIIFSVIVKIVVYPLTKKSYKSMKEMQRIQPIMTEIREKYKNEPQRMNKEMMSLYKEHGVNPFGGCIPMLLQMPLLIALFIVFRSTIQLRGASFIPGWIDDLSMADTVFSIAPISLPLYGSDVNILPILMAVTMIFQSKMTMQDPKQKMMVYLMPIFMLLIFNRFPSGLNLYYTMFNLLTIIQQKFINKSIDPAPVPVTKKKKTQNKK
jgi:YidC/Oxa1 family membrane protein insertase